MNWLQHTPDTIYEDRENLLFAVKENGVFIYYLVTIHFYEDGEFELFDQFGDSFTTWGLEDADFILREKDFGLPV